MAFCKTSCKGLVKFLIIKQNKPNNFCDLFKFATELRFSALDYHSLKPKLLLQDARILLLFLLLLQLSWLI